MCVLHARGRPSHADWIIPSRHVPGLSHISITSSCGDVIYFGGEGTGEGACRSRVTGSRTWASSEAELWTLRPALSDPFPSTRFHLLTYLSLPKLHHQWETMCSSTRAYQSKFTLKPQYLVYILLPKKHFLSHSLEAVLIYFKQRQNSNSFLSLSSSQTVYTGYSRMQMLKALERLKGLWVTTCGWCQGQEAGLRKEGSDCIGLERVWATQ